MMIFRGVFFRQREIEAVCSANVYGNMFVCKRKWGAEVQSAGHEGMAKVMGPYMAEARSFAR